MFPVNLIQFPEERKDTLKGCGGHKPDTMVPPLLHFSLVLVPALGLADAVLPPPVQDLLELLLLSADTSTSDQRLSEGRRRLENRNQTYFSHVSLSFFS